MIPKVIHYCWFGGKPLPDDVKAYMETWRRHFPDFEIKRWDESNFDVNALEYTRQAYFAKKYAFVSDVARLYALKTEGGLYFDTDILVKKPFPREWFDLEGFGSFEHDKYVQTGVIAAAPGNMNISEFYQLYRSLCFFKGLQFDLTPNVVRYTELLKRRGLVVNNMEQVIDGIRIFPQQLLCGKDWQKGRYDDETTYSVHDYSGTWGKEVLQHVIRHIIRSAVCVIKWRMKNLI